MAYSRQNSPVCACGQGCYIFQACFACSDVSCGTNRGMLFRLFVPVTPHMHVAAQARKSKRLHWYTLVWYYWHKARHQSNISLLSESDTCTTSSHVSGPCVLSVSAAALLVWCRGQCVSKGAEGYHPSCQHANRLPPLQCQGRPP